MDTVRNRVRSERWSSSYCKVIREPKQFSWYNDWRRHLDEDPTKWKLFLMLYFNDNDAELLSLNRAFSSAKEHYLSNREDHTFGGTHYLTRNLFISKKIDWANKGEVIATVGSHVFLKNVP